MCIAIRAMLPAIQWVGEGSRYVVKIFLGIVDANACQQDDDNKKKKHVCAIKPQLRVSSFVLLVSFVSRSPDFQASNCLFLVMKLQAACISYYQHANYEMDLDHSKITYNYFDYNFPACTCTWPAVFTHKTLKVKAKQKQKILVRAMLRYLHFPNKQISQNDASVNFHCQLNKLNSVGVHKTLVRSSETRGHTILCFIGTLFLSQTNLKL